MGLGLRYQAVLATARRSSGLSCAASRVTRENSASRQGVVRAMARFDHWRCVSTPRWVRVSWKANSSCQRWMNQRRTCSGVEGPDQQAQQQARRSVWAPDCPVGHAVVVHKPALPLEADDPQDAAHHTPA